MRRQLAISLRYCYSARRATQSMSASNILTTIGMCVLYWFYLILSLFSWA